MNPEVRPEISPAVGIGEAIQTAVVQVAPGTPARSHPSNAGGTIRHGSHYGVTRNSIRPRSLKSAT